jgi:hypothetical protein
MESNKIPISIDFYGFYVKKRTLKGGMVPLPGAKL